MHSYAEFVEMKRANVRNYVFVRRVIGMKEIVLIIRSPRVSSAFKCECELRLRLVVIFSLVREDLKSV